MKRIAILCLIVAASAWTLGCYGQSYRIPMFENDPRGIIIPVQVGDSLTATMSFDTGAYMDCFILDSAFAADHPLECWDIPADGTYMQGNSTWVDGPARHAERYSKKIEVNIAGADIIYPFFSIKDLMSDYTADVDGMFNFPREDSKHVWELNFENEYLEIHDVADFQMPKDCRLFPITIGNIDKLYPAYKQVYIQFPIRLTTPDGDTVIIDEAYLLDTGAIMDFAILNPAPELDFFRPKEPEALISHGNGFRSRYDVSVMAFGDTPIDSMRIYTIEDAAYVNTNYVIGLNFLKHFNVFFDLSTQTVGLQPVDGFERIVDPNALRFYFSSRFSIDGRQFVRMVSPFKNNPYWDAGLREGDEIVAVNGFMIRELTPENALTIRDSQTKILDILRDDAPMTLTVNIDAADNLGE